MSTNCTHCNGTGVCDMCYGSGIVRYEGSMEIVKWSKKTGQKNYYF